MVDKGVWDRWDLGCKDYFFDDEKRLLMYEGFGVGWFMGVKFVIFDFCLFFLKVIIVFEVFIWFFERFSSGVEWGCWECVVFGVGRSLCGFKWIG